MELKSTLTNRSNKILDVIYYDVEDESEFSDKKINSIHAYCFYGDKLLIVYAENKGYWTPVGGGVEKGESITEAIEREIKEESNMRVLQQKIIGYQDIYEPQRIISQVRSVCLVEPLGPFIADPDGDITEIRLIDPKDYKQYFDWGVIGDRIMSRALEIKSKL